jgi:hypothetical protein
MWFILHIQSRGSTRDGTGVHDSIVNQLLTKVGKFCSCNLSLAKMKRKKKSMPL